MSTNKQRLLAVLVAAAGLTSIAPTAQAAEPWLVRVRALYLDPANKDDIAGADLSVDSKTFPEVDISYFFTPNLAAELVLTYPQKHDLSLDGSKIGTLKHLPPTLSLQYHFIPEGSVRPYAGIGINYTRFSSVDLPAGLDVDRNSWGLAIGAGVDIPVAKNLLVNVDVKKVQIRTDVSAGGSKLGEFRVDPLLFSVGLGFKF
ncbi:OmpW/AlkL family protein [Caldimonas sp. KR1-144]|uniref:OmpW/AlkL family protein n=1 Tax=Caldimonas sp. KR1-144 TaxID=3400911 RepID=UPI003C0FB1FC